MCYKPNRVAIFGVDSLPLALIRAMPDSFPFLISLDQKGLLQEILSCDPPITVPAWSVVTTGKDPGELGTYGFRNRSSRGYLEYEISSSKRIKYPRIWDQVEEGEKAFVLGVPQTYPPSKIAGTLVSGILTPDLQAHWIEPPGDGAEFLEEAGYDYLFDVSGYRTELKSELMTELKEMLDQKHRVILKYLQKDVQFFMAVIIGSDRINHAFWKHVFRDHPGYEPNEEFEIFFRDYYRLLDTRLKSWYQLAKEQGFRPLIMSDHGAKSLLGVFCLQDFLIKKGYLVLKKAVPEGSILQSADVDWSKTRLWADGGYCGRIYVNKRGREPEGIVDSISTLFEELNQDLQETARTTSISMKLIPAKELYRRCAAVAPDFLLYIGNLDYRCAGKIHAGPLFLSENDTGPDGVNHDFYGIIAGDWGVNPPSRIVDVFDRVTMFLKGQL
ncbi:hypothetical protein HOF92_13855 [bacterium]|nr:hypothetical protein [bacterium]